MKNLVTSFIACLMAVTSLLTATQAVVFDWGNVIATNDRSIVVNFMCNSFHFTESDFESANHEKRKAMRDGKSDTDFWLEFAAKQGIQLPHDWPQQYTASVKKSVGADPKMYVLIDQLKDKGLRIGMLSNIDNRYKKMIRDFGFYAPFDPCLLSCEMGHEKPHHKAYELLLKTLNLPAEEVVFIDDKPENVHAAKKLGIDAILFKSEKQLRDELNKRGLL